MPLIIDIKVVPSSGRQEWKIDKNGTIKCFLTSAPERGFANKELIKIISKALRVPQRDVEILRGDTQRTKRIKIDTDISLADFLTSVGLGSQQLLGW